MYQVETELPTSLKICGITDAEDLSVCLEAAVPWVGFNFFQQSPRFIDPGAAVHLWRTAQMTASSAACGLVVEPKESDIRELVEVFPELSAVQIHSKAPASLDLSALKVACGDRQIWLAINVGDEKDVALAINLAKQVDLILLDSKSKEKNLLGGTGHSFDWKLLSAISESSGVRWGLAGGIGPDNIVEAFKAGSHLVDLCSRIEVSPGKKDLEKLQSVIDVWARVQK